MNSAFSEQILADKLSKLNSTQACIETLSHWCIFHRKNAELVVQTWEKQFHVSQKEQKASFLYVANDILQNSKRNGNEFVEEFWKVLPKALKDVLDNGDEHGKNVVSRLVNIWEQRRVFGSRARGLKDLMLGAEPPPALELNKKRSRSVRIVKRDSRSIKIKLSIGGTAERIVSAFHTVLSENPDEDIDLTKCKDAVRRVGKMEKDVDAACTRAADPRRTTLSDELQEKETIIKQSIEKLKLIESNRSALVSQLKEALQEQESELESVRTQIQVAQAQAEQAANMRRRLNNEPTVPSTFPSSIESNSNGPAAESSKRTAAAIAAEVADRLAASTHSQQIMTSVLSTFAAEEAKNTGPSPNTPGSYPEAPRMKLEKPMHAPVSVQPMVVSSSHQPQTILVQQAPMQNQVSTPQPQYNIYSTPTQQYLHPSGGVMIGLPYTYTALPQPPPPPPPQLMNLARPAPLTQQLQLQQQQMQQQQQPMVLQQPPPPPPPVHPHQPLQLNQPPSQFTLQQPAPPSYRPLQPPGMQFYHHQTQ